MGRLKQEYIDKMFTKQGRTLDYELSFYNPDKILTYKIYVDNILKFVGECDNYNQFNHKLDYIKRFL